MRRALAIALLAAATAAPSAAAEREPLDLRLFARVPEPGQPEPVAIGPGREVYVGTNQLGLGDADAPSRVFVYSSEGRLRRDYVLRGQDLSEDHGIQGLAFDRDRWLYALDRAARARVVRLNVESGRQRTYARFRDVPSCGLPPHAGGDCSATFFDMPAAPDYGAFAPNGDLYVTDIEQALIWRVPAGGGRPDVWFTDPRLENIFGPNGIQFMADGRTLLFAVTAAGLPTGNPFAGALYTLPVRRDGSPGRLDPFWRSRPLDGPDGFAIARSGNVYVALAGASQIVLLSPSGEETARVPANPIENLLMEVPLDGPASLAFMGRRILFSNHSPILGNPRSWAIFDLYAGERGLPLHYPRL